MFYSILPIPTNIVRDREDERSLARKQQQSTTTTLVAIGECKAPPYGQRKGWIPRAVEVILLFFID